MIPPTRSALDFEQDLYLLWPGEVAAGPAKADFALPPEVAAHVEVVAQGRLRLFAQRHYEAAPDTEEIPPGAAFVTVVRSGGPLGRSPAATYIRIPWNHKIANQAWLVGVQLTARGLVKPKPTTWLGRMVSGPRHLLALGFNDVGPPAMFSTWGWLAAVSHWEVERHELEIALQDGVVQDIQVRLDRTRLAQRQESASS